MCSARRQFDSSQSIYDLAVRFFDREPNAGLSTKSQLRFGSHGKISVELYGEKVGAWYDHAKGEGGYLQSEDMAPYQRDYRPRTEYSYDQGRAEVVRAYLSESRPPQNTPVDLYLRSRGIRCPLPHSVRFLPSPPAMVTIYQNKTGDALAIQLTYLTRDGRKAERAIQKQTFKTGDGWQKFSAIRIPGKGKLILCEGFENGLTLHQETGRPVWACGSVSNIAAIRVPQKRFTIATDGDEPGSSAYETYKRAFDRFMGEGKAIDVASPSVGQDFNSVLMEHGAGRVLEIVLGAVQQCRP